MFALIHQKPANAMQSGRRGVGRWIIEFPHANVHVTDPLTGSTSGIDPYQQIDLEFATKDEAIAYAKSKGIAYQVMELPKTKRIPRSYAENFAFERKFPWTH